MKKIHCNWKVGLLIAVGVILLCTFVLILFVCNQSSWVASANDVKIGVKQMRDAMNDCRTNVLSTVSNSTDDITVKSKIKELALKQCVKTNIIIGLAKREGLTNASNYDELMAQREEENNQRKKTAQQGGAVYGPVEYTSQAYFQYKMNELQLKLASSLSNKELKFSEEELKSYFEANKKNFAYLPKSAEILIFFYDSTNNTDKDALKQLESIQSALKNGNDIKELISSSKNIQTYSTSLTPNSQSASRDPFITKVAFEMRKGETSEILDNKSRKLVIHCISSNPEREASFEEVLSNVRSALMKEKLKSYINTCTNKSVIKTNTFVYNKL